MVIAQDKMSDVYARPPARFTPDGAVEVRASALGDCRRALWLHAAGLPVTDPPAPEALTVMETGNALEPVVLRAMERAGWTISPVDPAKPIEVSVELGPGLAATGHPDATGVMPLFDGEAVIEVKTRSPEAFKRWRTLGAERSHPSAAAQAAVYTLGVYGEHRDAVIACMDTGSRRWDYEVIPGDRLEAALRSAADRLASLTEHHALHGPDAEVLPERDFAAGSWQCNSCPFLTACRPGWQEEVANDERPGDDDPGQPLTDAQAQRALLAYEELHETARDIDREKQEQADALRRWLRQRGTDRASLPGRERVRTIRMVSARRYSVDHRRLNALLDPETRAEIVTEQVSTHLRVG